MKKWTKYTETIIFMCTMSILYGLHVASLLLNGMYFIHYQYDLGATASEASIAVSLTSSLLFLGGPLFAALYRNIGPKRCLIFGSLLQSCGIVVASFMPSITLIQLSFGTLCSIGIGVVNISVYSMVGQTFSTRRSLANSFVTSAGPLVSFFGAPLLQLAISTYGWRRAMMLEGGFVLNAIPAAMIMTKFFFKFEADKEANNPEIQDLNENINETNESCSSSTSQEFIAESKNPPIKSDCKNSFVNLLRKAVDLSLLKDGLFFFYCTSVAFGVIARISVNFYLVRLAQDIGIDDDKAAYMLSISQITSFVFCPTIGAATSIKQNEKSRFDLCSKIERSDILFCVLCYTGIVMLIPVIFQTFQGLIAYSLLVGLATGGIGALPVTVMADLFGAARLPSLLGIRSLFCGIAMMVTPAVIGKLVDIVGSFQPAQIFMSASAFISAIMVAVAQKLYNRRIKHDLDKIGQM